MTKQEKDKQKARFRYYRPLKDIIDRFKPEIILDYKRSIELNEENGELCIAYSFNHITNILEYRLNMFYKPEFIDFVFGEQKEKGFDFSKFCSKEYSGHWTETGFNDGNYFVYSNSNILVTNFDGCYHPDKENTNTAILSVFEWVTKKHKIENYLENTYYIKELESKINSLGCNDFYLDYNNNKIIGIRSDIDEELGTVDFLLCNELPEDITLKIRFSKKLFFVCLSYLKFKSCDKFQMLVTDDHSKCYITNFGIPETIIIMPKIPPKNYTREDEPENDSLGAIESNQNKAADIITVSKSATYAKIGEKIAELNKCNSELLVSYSKLDSIEADIKRILNDCNNLIEKNKKDIAVLKNN